MDETLKERAENYIRRFTSLHNQVKTALTTKANSTAMELLEQCQKIAQELADMIETEAPKALSHSNPGRLLRAGVSCQRGNLAWRESESRKSI